MKETFEFNKNVYIGGGAAIVGPKEGEGPLKQCFDKVYSSLQSENGVSWEDTEIRMQKEVLNILLEKCCFKESAVDLLLGGDLIDQLTITNFAAKERDIPFLGLYNACATMAEGLLLGASLIGGGFVGNAVVVASSHNATSERQYRFPTELGTQRPQTGQWTVTGAGAMHLTRTGGIVKISSGTVGRIIDYGIKDTNEMGAAMAPAAADTIYRHLKNRQQSPLDYDLICSGDLGSHGHCLLKELLNKKGIHADERFQDGGMWMYDKKQDVHAGGSGAGCSASIWSSYVLDRMIRGKYHHVLLVGTGALLSAVSAEQGKTIPGIAHAVEWNREES